MQKAWALESVGNINPKDVEIPRPAEGEALIRVKAAGICGSDVPCTYQNGAHKMPLIIGHEFSGEVVEAFAGNESWVGKPLYFDCVGKSETISLGAEVLSPAGTMVCVGNPYSDIAFPQNTYWKILRNQLTLVGTWNSSFTKEETDDWRYVLARLKSQSVHPEQFISHCLSIEELEKGLLIMRDKTEEYCKIIIKVSNIS